MSFAGPSSGTCAVSGDNNEEDGGSDDLPLSTVVNAGLNAAVVAGWTTGMGAGTQAGINTGANAGLGEYEAQPTGSAAREHDSGG